MRSFSKKLAFVLAAAMVFTSFAPAAKAEAAKEMVINKSSQILYVTDGDGINDAAQVGGGKGNVSEYDFYVKNKPDDWKKTLKFEWSSSDEDVATVNQSGLTTAVGVGKATISCKITEKKTGDVVTTSKVKVTVKANAAEVEISNAATVAGAYEVGATVDLNRTMYDADGNKATSRTKGCVTDYTEWLVEPKTGVEITQSNGKYTFTEPGEYTLWCRTYQSSKYTKTTAESEKITVVIEDKTFDVAQVSSRVFNLVFGMKTTVKPGDVTVLHNIVNTAGVSESYELLIKNVEMNTDGTAKVTLFDPLEHEGNYTIKVKDREDKNYTAHVGEPKKVVVKLKGKAEADYQVSVANGAELDYVLYDAKNIDVTAEYDDYKNYIEYTVHNDDYTGTYGLNGNTIYFNEAGDKVTIVATYYPSTPFDEYGNELQPIVSAPKTFVGVQEGAFKLGGLIAYGTGVLTWTNDWNKNVRLGEEAKFYVKAATNKANYEINFNKYGQELIPKKWGVEADAFLGYANFTALNPDILSVYEQAGTSDAILVPHAQGTAVISVSAIQNIDGRDVEPTIGLAYIKVLEARKLTKVDFRENNITISMNPADFSGTVFEAGVETDGNTTEVENKTIDAVLYDQDTPGWWTGQYNYITLNSWEIKGSNKASQKTLDDGAIEFVTVDLGDGKSAIKVKLSNRKYEEAINEMIADLSYDINQKTGSYRFGYELLVRDARDYNNVKKATFVVNVRRHIVDNQDHVKGHSVDVAVTANNTLANLGNNIARHDDRDNNSQTDWTAEKTASFKVYEYCNTAKYDEIEFTPLTNALGTDKYGNGVVKALSGGTFVVDDTASDSASHYYFKILKNGKDITKAALENKLKNGDADELLSVGGVAPFGNVATYRFSTVDKSNHDATKNVVYYQNNAGTIGAGRYEFVLYSVADKTGAYKRLDSNSITVKYDDGKYQWTFRNEVELEDLTAKSVFKCFAIKDQFGNDLDINTVTGNNLYSGTVQFGPDGAKTGARAFKIEAYDSYFNKVDGSGNIVNNNGDTLFVKRIVFWETLAGGDTQDTSDDVFAEYVVDINKYVDYRYFN